MNYVFSGNTCKLKTMKKTLLLLLLASCGLLKAQNTYTDLPGRWRLGFNMGAIWESSDVKPIPGLGGGFNLEKILNKRSNALLGFSLGFRYLGGRTYGLNTGPTYDLVNNNALNGTLNPAINYDTVPGFFYANHKTFIQEGALELKMNFPRLERNTNIIFHLWGGIGIGKYKTWVDALDKDGKMYDFSSLSGKTVSQSDLTRIYDGKYETLAEGSGTSGTIKIMPSLGIGLGYHLSKSVALVFEHKVTFPGTNWLDGIDYNKNCPVTGTNDFYNYTSVGLVFTFYGHHSTSGGTASNNTVHTNTITPTQTVTSNNYTPPPAPGIIITYPANNFISPSDYTTVNATLQHVTSSQQISISQNGFAINHFTYNAYNGTLHFQTFLNVGLNNFVIVATTPGGTASQGLSVNYDPVPNFNTTGHNTYTNNTTTVTATSTVVTTNTVSAPPTHTVAPTHSITPTGTVVTHSVTPTISVTPTGTITSVNTSTAVVSESVTPTGTVVASHTVTPTISVTPTGTGTTITTATTVTSGTSTITTAGLGKKPIVTFINPNTYQSVENLAFSSVNATIQYITNAGQVGVVINGAPFTGFTFNPSTKTVSFTATLVSGYNTITITGTNAAGSDAQSVVINYKPPGQPPKVVISNPASSPFVTLQNNVIVSGYVYNVNSSADIQVKANGSPATFNYNMNTHAIDVSIYLHAPSTQVVISASNSYGNDSRNVELQLMKVSAGSGDSAQSPLTTVTTQTRSAEHGAGLHGSHHLPVITISSPNVSPFYTNTGVISVAGTVEYIIQPNSVNVTYNGQMVSSTFDMGSQHLDFTSPLKPGINTFVITATNNDGSINKSIDINYTPVNVNTNSGGNNSNNTGGPTFNHGTWNLGGGGAVKQGGGVNVPNTGNQNQQAPKVNDGGGQSPNPVRTINPPPVQTPPKADNPGGGIRPRGLSPR